MLTAVLVTAILGSSLSAPLPRHDSKIEPRKRPIWNPEDDTAWSVDLSSDVDFEYQWLGDYFEPTPEVSYSDETGAPIVVEWGRDDEDGYAPPQAKVAGAVDPKLAPTFPDEYEHQTEGSYGAPWGHWCPEGQVSSLDCWPGAAGDPGEKKMVIGS